MRYRELGTLSVSEVGLGSWLTIGRDRQQRVDALVRAALDLGVNLFDTADSYDGAQEALGGALRGVPRDDYVISTKVYYPYPGGSGGLSRDHILSSARRSLRQLGVDHLDLLSAHRFDDSVPLPETIGAFAELVAAGAIRHYGVSEWTAAQISEACRVAEEIGAPRPVSNQPQYNVVWRVPEGEVVPTCQRFGLGLVAFWPLAQGILTGKYRPGRPAPAQSRGATDLGRQTMSALMHDAVLDRVELLGRLAARRGLTTAQLAIAWVLNRPGVRAAVVGASGPEQLTENVGGSGVRLDGTTMALVDKVLTGLVHTDVTATG
ncbi:aldo/keto reductase [Micromonospora sp. NPDC002296]|uniref:aldo/keto reductase n=1 Tax=Micromonospora sp. NPDC002296 TaxID=3154271 RepID=UPI0033215BF3